MNRRRILYIVSVIRNRFSQINVCLEKIGHHGFGGNRVPHNSQRHSLVEITKS